MQFLKRLIIGLILLTIFFLGVFFTLQNTVLVPLNLYFIQLEGWLALWVMLAFVLGGLLGMLVTMLTVLAAKREQLRLKRQLKAANKELDKLRVAPLASGAGPKASS